MHGLLGILFQHTVSYTVLYIICVFAELTQVACVCDLLLCVLQVKSRKSVFGSPSSRATGHLVHPGAVLCMVDLLPSVDVATQTASLAEEEDEDEDDDNEVRGTIYQLQSSYLVILCSTYCCVLIDVIVAMLYNIIPYFPEYKLYFFSMCDYDTADARKEGITADFKKYGCLKNMVCCI